MRIDVVEGKEVGALVQSPDHEAFRVSVCKIIGSLHFELNFRLLTLKLLPKIAVHGRAEVKQD